MNPIIETFDARGFALKKETVEGTDALPTSALNAFQILDGKAKLTADPIERKLDRPFWNSARSKYANWRATIDGSIELVPPTNPGVGSASVGLALEICGMAKTLTAPAVGPPVVKGLTQYNMISRAIASATGYFWHAGTLRKPTNMRGNISGLTNEIDKYLMAQLSLEGPCTDILEDDLPDDFDFDLFLEPTLGETENMELLINDFAVNGLSHSVDFGNQVKTSSHTEARRTKIGTRASTFKAKFYRTIKADFDPIARWRAGDIIEVQSTVVDADNNFCRVLSLGQITGLDEPNVDNEYAWEISGKLTAVTGGDELLIGFGQV
jgi:hypothetical protein